MAGNFGGKSGGKQNRDSRQCGKSVNDSASEPRASTNPKQSRMMPVHLHHKPSECKEALAQRTTHTGTTHTASQVPHLEPCCLCCCLCRFLSLLGRPADKVGRTGSRKGNVIMKRKAVIESVVNSAVNTYRQPTFNKFYIDTATTPLRPCHHAAKPHTSHIQQTVSCTPLTLLLLLDPEGWQHHHQQLQLLHHRRRRCCCLF